MNVIFSNFSPIDLEQYQFIESLQGKTIICASDEDSISFESKINAIEEAVSDFNVKVIENPTKYVTDHIEDILEASNGEHITFYLPTKIIEESRNLLDFFDIKYDIKPYDHKDLSYSSYEDFAANLPLTESTIKELYYEANSKFSSISKLNLDLSDKEKFEICSLVPDGLVKDKETGEKIAGKNFIKDLDAPRWNPTDRILNDEAEKAKFEDKFIKSYIKEFILTWHTSPDWEIAYNSAKAHLYLVERGISMRDARDILRQISRRSEDSSICLDKLPEDELVREELYKVTIKNLEKEDNKNKKSKMMFSMESLVRDYHKHPDDYVLLNLAGKDVFEDRGILYLEDSKKLGVPMCGDEYLDWVEEFKKGWIHPTCQKLASVKDFNDPNVKLVNYEKDISVGEYLHGDAIDITKTGFDEKILLFIKPNVSQNAKATLNICKHNESFLKLRRKGFNTEENFCGWHDSGASIYSLPVSSELIKAKAEKITDVTVDSTIRVFYVTGNEGDAYEKDVANDLRMIWQDQKNKEEIPYEPFENRYVTDDDGNYVTRTGWKISAALKNLIETADTYLETDSNPDDCLISLKEIKETFGGFLNIKPKDAKSFKKFKTNEEVPIIVDTKSGVLSVADYYTNPEKDGYHLETLDNLRKHPTVPKMIDMEDGTHYIAIHAGGNDSRVSLSLNDCVSKELNDVVEIEDMEKTLKSNGYRPYLIADIIFISCEPDSNGLYRYLPISLKNGSNTLGQIGVTSATHESVEELVNQEFEPLKKSKYDANNFKKVREIITEYVFACTKEGDGNWKKGNPWYVTDEYFNWNGEEPIPEMKAKEPTDHLVNATLINELLMPGEKSEDSEVTQWIDGANEDQQLFNHKILLNMVKLGRRYGYLKKCKNEEINEDSFYARLGDSNLIVSRIRFTNRPAFAKDGKTLKNNTNSISIDVNIEAKNHKGQNVKKNFTVFLGSDKSSDINNMMKIMTNENKIVDISIKLVNLLS